MIIQNQPNIKPKGLSLYLFLSLMIHAVIFAWLYHFNLLTPPKEPVDLIPVEIIAHGESPTYAQVEPIIQPRIPVRKSFNLQNLTFSQRETGKLADARPVPLGEKPEPELILPAKLGEPVAHYATKDKLSERPLKSTAFTTARRSYPQHWSVLPTAQDQAAPLRVEVHGSMVTTGVESLISIQQTSGYQKSSQVDTIPRPSPVSIKHLSEPFTDPGDRIPYLAAQMQMTLAGVNAISPRSGQRLTPKHRPEIISPTIFGHKLVEKPLDSPQILVPNTELALLNMDYPPSFPLPGSPQGAIFLLAIDTSGSVKGAPLKGIKKSAHDFVNLMGPKDLAGIITFDDSVRKTGSFTADKAALHQKIDGLRPTGTRTVLYDALPAAIEMLEKRDGKKRFIVLFSDGKDEGSQATLEKAIVSLRRSEISILAVGYTRVEKKYLKILSAIAGETSGIFVRTPQFRDMISLYRLSRHADMKPHIMEPTKKKSTETFNLISLTGQLKAFTESQDARFLQLWTRKKVYRIGDSIEYHFQSSQDCHLIIILFSSSDEIMQVFPNRDYPDSFISTGITYTIPSPDSDNMLVVAGPPGTDELVAVISDAPLKIFPFNPHEKSFFVVGETDRLLIKEIHNNLQLAKKKDLKHKSAQYTIER